MFGDRAFDPPLIAARRHGTTPSNSISSEKLRNVRTNTITPSTRALSAVGSMKVAFDFDVNGKFVETQLGRVRARR